MPNDVPDKRSKFLRRISTMGGGVREALQMAVGGVVTDLREFIEKGLFEDADLDVIVSFHDDTEELWRRMIMSNPPMGSAVLLEKLQDLEGRCSGPLQGFGVRLTDLREKAEIFHRTRSGR